jgi:hypothetical protein
VLAFFKGRFSCSSSSSAITMSYYEPQNNDMPTSLFSFRFELTRIYWHGEHDLSLWFLCWFDLRLIRSLWWRKTK